MKAPKEPLVPVERTVESLSPGEVLVRVAGCGLCHTDIGFYGGGVRTNHPLPLTLGHEVSGTVESAGRGAEAWEGKAVVVPAILPCGECRSCRRGRYALCPSQIFPGNDVHGGFASHLVVPARYLCEVGRALHASLPLLSVVADAVSTPYEAIRRSGLEQGDIAIFVGVGGVGGFGVQIAAALGAHVIAIDPVETRRRLAIEHGAALALDPSAEDAKAIRKGIRDHAKEHKRPAEEWKVFETSGTAAGQGLAFALLGRGAHLGVVGFTPEKVTVLLSRLMALDARAEGNWGCAPAHYPELLRLIGEGEIVIEPFVVQRPLSEINSVFQDMLEHRLEKRAILVPDFS
jgi:6-hydroxycyclohex-1-ene-1-carbonyl-CoA dehydrogenase